MCKSGNKRKGLLVLRHRGDYAHTSVTRLPGISCKTWGDFEKLKFSAKSNPISNLFKPIAQCSRRV